LLAGGGDVIAGGPNHEPEHGHPRATAHPSDPPAAFVPPAAHPSDPPPAQPQWGSDEQTDAPAPTAPTQPRYGENAEPDDDDEAAAPRS
ncbi:MAG: hypothetical protein ABI310_07680, partial [Microbacteriaceae bacterium]